MLQNCLSLLHLDEMSSQIKEETGFQCTWQIENFAYCPDKGRGLRSPAFVPETVDQSSWRLCVLPRTGIDGKYISLFLYRHVGGPYSVTIDYEFEILAADGTPFAKLRHPRKVFRNGCIHGFTNLLSRSDAAQKGLIASVPHTFTLVCRMWIGEDKPSTFKQGTLRTTIGTCKRSFNWDFTNFSNIGPNQEQICPAELKLNLPMDIKLYHNDIYQDELQIDIIGDKNAVPNSATCKISVLGAGLKIILSMEDDHIFEDHRAEYPWKFPRFIIWSKLFENSAIYLPNNVLTLRFEFVVSNGTIAHEMSYGPPSVDFNKSTEINGSSFLREDLNRLYRDGIFCDISLRAKSGETFQGHKNILCARSPVLRIMIENSMKEMFNNTIEIPDVDDDTLQQMLVFMYADAVDDLTRESASKLYAAGNKYLLQGLQEECSAFLKRNLSVANVCDVLVLADTHQDLELKSSAKDFILNHEKKVIQSEDWSEMFRSNLQLAAETLQWLCVHKLQD